MVSFKVRGEVDVLQMSVPGLDGVPSMQGTRRVLGAALRYGEQHW
jgi:hypothetical protein